MLTRNLVLRILINAELARTTSSPRVSLSICIVRTGTVLVIVIFEGEGMCKDSKFELNSGGPGGVYINNVPEPMDSFS